MKKLLKKYRKKLIIQITKVYKIFKKNRLFLKDNKVQKKKTFIIKAFQRRFRPELINGKIDLNVLK